MNVPIRFTDDPVLKARLGVWEDSRLYRRDLPAGTAKWAVDYKSLNFVCPCGCGVVGTLTVRVGTETHPGWDWDGNVEHPTLKPSIRKTSACKWHGHLTKGVFEPC